jgi:hypothetical protein
MRKAGWLLLWALVLIPALGAAAQKEDSGKNGKLEYPKGIHWLGNRDAAFKEAAERNCPVMVAFIHGGPGQKLCDMTTATFYSHKTVIQLSRKLVCLMANRGSHTQIKGRGADGRIKKVCSKFGTVSCEEHRRVERWAFARFNEKGQITPPEHVFLDPKGKILDRFKHTHATTPEALCERMKKAVDRVGPGIGTIAYRRLKEKLKVIDGWIRARSYRPSIEALQGIIARAGRSVIGTTARDLLGRIDQAVVKEVKAIDRLIAARDFDGARDRANRAEREFRGLRSARVIKDRLELVEGRSGSGARTADHLLKKAERELAAKRYAGAVELLNKIVKRYPTTPSATTAREHLQAFESDPELKKALETSRAHASCARWMKLADALVKTGRRQAARVYYEKIVKTHPGSRHAAEAKKKLAKL